MTVVLPPPILRANGLYAPTTPETTPPGEHKFVSRPSEVIRAPGWKALRLLPSPRRTLHWARKGDQIGLATTGLSARVRIQ